MDEDGYTPRDGDCDDDDSAIHPGAVELCDDVDNNCDGFVDNGLGYTQVQETDNLADGVADSWTYSTYRPTGGIWYREVDSNADGAIDTIEEYFYVYDASGRLSAYEIDTGMDGSINYRKSYFYDAAGRMDRTEDDFGPDGVADRIDTYIYDAAGVRVAWEMDSNADGQVDTLYSYEYGATGLLLTLWMERFNTEGELASMSMSAYDYDGNGRMSHVHSDLTGDGVLDNTTAYAYDALGRMDTTLADFGRDLVVDSASYYHYDLATGSLAKIEMDTNFDGALDMRISRWDICNN